MLLFDMDGTLIDSNGVWKNVDREFLARRGIAYTHAYYEGVAHTILPLAAKFTKEYCRLTESCEEIIAEWMEMARDAYAHVTVKPGVRAYLKQCRAEGRRMAVVTSSVPEHCRTALTHLDLMKYFEVSLWPTTWGWRKRTRPCGVPPQSTTAWHRRTARCSMTASPPARAPGLQRCGWWAFTTVSSPRTRRPCGDFATCISGALRSCCFRPGRHSAHERPA